MCKHCQSALPERSFFQSNPELDYKIADQELKTGVQLAHGLLHLANLLALDPGSSTWRDLLDKYIVSSDDIEQAIDNESSSPALDALRAYFWQKQGILDEAMILLLNVSESEAKSKYLEIWGAEWLEAEGSMNSLSSDTGWQLFASVLARAPEASYATERIRRRTKTWASLCSKFVKAKAEEEPFPYAKMLEAGLLRKAGEFDLAERIVREALSGKPEWQSCVALGMILRERNQLLEAEEAFKLALEFEPGDLSARQEAGDMFLKADRWQSAALWYESILSLREDDEFALPSNLYCLWQLSRDKSYLFELIALARNKNERARQLYYRSFGGLPAPADASASILRQFREDIIRGTSEVPRGQVELSLPYLEAPSNYLAFRLEMQALNHDLELMVSIDEIQEPDQRVPFKDCKYCLWTYNESTAHPSLKEPDKKTSAEIAAIALSRFEESLNWAQASRAAERLGPAKVPEILASMTYPPQVPKGEQALNWLPRVQLAAAQVLAQIDEGWFGSERREALLSLLFGPSDWTTNAAIRALTFLAEEEPACSHDIGSQFAELAEYRPYRGYCCWEFTLYNSWIRLPHLSEEEREKLELRLLQIERS